jgi:hypothetical protein
MNKDADAAGTKPSCLGMTRLLCNIALVLNEVANCRENRLVSTVAIALNLLAFPIIAFDVCFYY